MLLIIKFCALLSGFGIKAIAFTPFERNDMTIGSSVDFSSCKNFIAVSLIIFFAIGGSAFMRAVTFMKVGKMFSLSLSVALVAIKSRSSFSVGNLSAALLAKDYVGRAVPFLI